MPGLLPGRAVLGLARCGARGGTPGQAGVVMGRERLAGGSGRPGRCTGGGGARWTSGFGAGVRWRPVNRRAISLRVSGIICGGGGWACSAAAARQEGQGEHGQGDPPVPGRPAADLMLIQAGQALPGLEIFLGGPSEPGDLDQGGQWDRVRAVAAVEGQFPGSPVAADQQPAVAGPALVMVIQAQS